MPLNISVLTCNQMSLEKLSCPVCQMLVEREGYESPPSFPKSWLCLVHPLCFAVAIFTLKCFMFVSASFILLTEKEGVDLNNHLSFPQAQSITPICVACIY